MKRGRKFIFIFSLMIILSTGIAVAESHGFWARITGDALAPGSISCTDYDGKNNFLKASFVRLDGKINFYDYCSENVAYDYYCSSNDIIQQRVSVGSAYAISSSYGSYGKTDNNFIY